MCKNILNRNMKVVICAIAKNENNYINDWVNYHIKLGFDHIYLFDNNSCKTAFVGDAIEQRDKVTIYDKRSIKKTLFQTECYNEFYEAEKDNFDWCLFFDIDEFLAGVDNVKDFLSNKKYADFLQIRILWKTFTDDNLITRDIKVPVWEAFKTITHNQSLNKQGKAFVRGHLNNAVIGVHRARIRNPETGETSGAVACLTSGEACDGEEFIYGDTSKETVFINHYRTKSLQEFIDQKIGRGDACRALRIIDFEYYWNVNEKTEAKLTYLKAHGFEA